MLLIWFFASQPYLGHIIRIGLLDKIKRVVSKRQFKWIPEDYESKSLEFVEIYDQSFLYDETVLESESCLIFSEANCFLEFFSWLGGTHAFNQEERHLLLTNSFYRRADFFIAALSLGSTPKSLIIDAQSVEPTYYLVAPYENLLKTELTGSVKEYLAWDPDRDANPNNSTETTYNLNLN